jgi:hypothetical protein
LKGPSFVGLSQHLPRRRSVLCEFPNYAKTEPGSCTFRDIFVIQRAPTASGPPATAARSRGELTAMISKKIRIALMWATMVLALVASSGIASANTGWH